MDGWSVSAGSHVLRGPRKNQLDSKKYLPLGNAVTQGLTKIKESKTSFSPATTVIPGLALRTAVTYCRTPSRTAQQHRDGEY